MTEVPDAAGRPGNRGDEPWVDAAAGGGPVVDMVALEDVRGVESAVVVVDRSGGAEVVVGEDLDRTAGDTDVADRPGKGVADRRAAGGSDQGHDHADDSFDQDDDLDDDVDDADGSADPLAALGALFGGGDGSNPLAGLLAQAQQLQEGMVDAQRRLGEQRVSGTSGGGLVRATVTGTGELVALRLDPSVVDPTDVDTLADLVIAAVRAATADARALGEREASAAMPAMPTMPGFGGVGGGPSRGSFPGFPGLDQLPDFGQLPDLGQLPDFGQLPGGGRLPDHGGVVGGGAVPDLRRIPDAGPLAAPAGDEPEDDDLGPAGRPAGV